MKNFILRGALFGLLTFCFFTMLIYGTSAITYMKGKSVLKQVTKNFVKRGGDTFIKFYEAENLEKPVDILIIGSSRAFRSFEPGVFESHNLNVHILATSSQAPVNTYFIIKKYLSIVKPKLVILDIHLGLLNYNGLESLYDLCTNIPIAPELFEMAYSIDQPNAYTNCYAALINQLDTPIYRDYKYKARPSYYKGFMVSYKIDSTIRIGEKDTLMDRRGFLHPQEKKNLQYIEDIVEFVQKSNTGIILTRQPVLSPEPRLSQQSVKAIARKYKISYIDLNKFRSILNPVHDYYDKNHLNTYGAKLMSEKFIEEMKKTDIKF